MAEGEIFGLGRGLVLSPDAVRVRRVLALGASRAAHAALAERPASERDEALCFATPETTRIAFDAAARSTVRLDILLAAFMPTAVIHAVEPLNGDTLVERWRDDAPPHDIAKGLLALGLAGEVLHVRGESWLVPPAFRGEGQRRTDWMRAIDLDPPSAREEAGPFWSLGQSELWRLDLLGWREQVVLAAAIGTRMPVSTIVCHSADFPRIGYVVETIRSLGRTVVHVPLPAVPEELLAQLNATRSVRLRGRQGVVVAAPKDGRDDAGSETTAGAGTVPGDVLEVEHG
jgi:hypothetical protein